MSKRRLPVYSHFPHLAGCSQLYRVRSGRPHSCVTQQLPQLL